MAHSSLLSRIDFMGLIEIKKYPGKYITQERRV